MAGSPTPAPCQVRSKTESPCPNLAVAEIRGVAFCGPCAREQEAYFAIGEIVARGEARGPRGKPLAEALGRVRRGSAGAKEGVAARTRRGPSGAHETGRPALGAG
ncbi:MAG: hypothetical protein AVDCRST_MAG02-1801 [uncultured Rubrobacteraceae bacterium]|uniref:Uncharacterized protein n=1 Tax=uncultured Rubrobacteraceae bacterium TaxID=349277 RepID=A0A6J4QXV0_9ACTN|nr:MAG: hypothetical protein AVDCRST_MAG02-1801 [uncultured Rubrobacteraceae bacterium]